MNLGDGLLFELENGKPKLILLSHGVEKNPAKQLSFRPRAANILSSRQPSCVEEVQEEHPAWQQAGRHREARSKAEGTATSFTCNTASTEGRSTRLTLSKTHDHNKGPKVKPERHKYNTTVYSQRANGKTGQPQTSGARGSAKTRLKDTLVSGETGSKDDVVCLTQEQQQQILSSVQASSNGQHPPEDHRTKDSQSGSVLNGEGEKNTQEDRGGEAIKKGERGITDTTGSSQDKDSRLSGCLFSWLEERHLDRAAINAKKAQWRKELDEQVALKQRSAPGRLQAEEETESVFSVQSSISLREQPAAIRSSLKLGEVTPMEEVLSAERRKEQRKHWLEELDRQKEETAERRRQEKLLQSQTEDHELWATHFESLQRRPAVHTTALSTLPPAPSRGSERGEWEPLSRLSLVGEAESSCGAESVAGASVDTTSGYQTRASYLRTMTALLDPAQIEERERRRLKQLEQQRAIEAQVEERRQQREREEVRRREEEEEEERRVALEREMLQRQYEWDSKREWHKVREQHLQQLNNQAEQPKETLKPSAVTRHCDCLEEEEVSGSVSLYKDTAVQTEAAPSLPLRAERVQTSDVSAQYEPPSSLSAAPPPNRSRAVRAGKENVCLPGGKGGGDPYEAFARTERSRRDKWKPEWNTQRPSCQFVPASARYPAALQRSRQESRLKRQAELLALQERTCLPRTDLAPPQNPTQTETSPSRKVESVSRGQCITAAVNTERGRSPPVPAVRQRVQSQQESTPSVPVLEFIPYVRTDEVFNLDPLEPADTPPPHTQTAPAQSSAAPPAPSYRDPLLHPELFCSTRTHRQQEILRGLAQLRQGLLQKQRELETDLSPLHNDGKLRLPSATHRM